jgi:hypothetical protein
MRGGYSLLVAAVIVAVGVALGGLFYGGIYQFREEDTGVYRFNRLSGAVTVCAIEVGCHALREGDTLPHAAPTRVAAATPNAGVGSPVSDFWKEAVIIPEAEATPKTPKSPGRENPIPAIPQAFFGCWKAGTSDKPDSWIEYTGPRLFGRILRNETICFRRGLSGTEVALRTTRTAHAAINLRDKTAPLYDPPIFNYESHAYISGTWGPNQIALHAFGSDREYLNSIDFTEAPLVSITWIADSSCAILPNDLGMSIETSEAVSCSGATGCTGGPLYSAIWHGAFHRIADSQSPSATLSPQR